MNGLSDYLTVSISLGLDGDTPRSLVSLEVTGGPAAVSVTTATARELAGAFDESSDVNTILQSYIADALSDRTTLIYADTIEHQRQLATWLRSAADRADEAAGILAGLVAIEFDAEAVAEHQQRALDMLADRANVAPVPFPGSA